ncbi:acyl-CoA dehydrogenase family protein [Williamsia herbipolensis]|uniref:acyl-CoA dehydrogenase family protein n=1 Tax=Williamsia herbipolensis TaxID=1603258 RepID=UPI0005F804D1|nr:acyl-CoA dehydrogenase family protein [Williamsia herbipolensis]
MSDTVFAAPGVDTAEQSALRDSVRTVLARQGGSASLRAAMAATPRFDGSLWRTLAEQVGVAALAVPERFGGVGATLVESHIVLEELGRSLHPVPMLGAVLATQALLLTRDDDACARLLPGIAEGSSVAALCWADESGWDTRGVVADGGLLTGTAHYVLDGEYADVFLVIARSGTHTTLHEVSPDADGVSRTPLPVLDPTRPLTRVTFDDTPAQTIAAPGDLIGRLQAVASVALSAEQVGVSAELLDRTVAHTSARTQFGRPIGSFQALKHRMADMFVAVESARSISYAAAHALAHDSGPDGADPTIAAARIHCSRAAAAVAGEAVQMHGGIGITWEHDVQLYFKRAHTDAQLFKRPQTANEGLARTLEL